MLLIHVACLCLTASSSLAQSTSIRDWTTSDFRSRGHIEIHPPGEHSAEFKFWKWPGDNTMLDLRGSVFFAHENGSFTEENIPRPGASLSGFRECVSSEKYPLSIRGRGSKNILVSGGGRVIGVQPRALPWRAMKSFYDGDGIRIKAPGEKNCR